MQSLTMKICLLLSVALLRFANSSAQDAKFSCPLTDGEIVNYHYSSEVAAKPGATFQSKSSDVYNIAEGIVKSIDTISGLINVYVESGDYFFSFHNFERVEVKKGQTISLGFRIGALKKGEKLFLIMSFKDELVDPSKYLKCKSVDVQL